MSEQIRVSLPHGATKLLLHSCCAPCSGDMMEILLASNIDVTVFFYNPNIQPKQEYHIRKEENKRFARQNKIPFIDADYEQDVWLQRTQGLECEPERGARCTICFNMRLERAALYAHEHGFKILTSSLGISRWKNFQQVNECGQHAVIPYADLMYWTYNWRKQGGTQRMTEISKREHFYQQQYCGCIHSLRAMNIWRQKNGRKPINLKYNEESNNII